MAHCEFIIPYPSTKEGKAAWNKRFGLNAYYAGKHWTKRQKDAEYWHKLVWAEMERQKVKFSKFNVPVCIRFWFNDRLDIDNDSIFCKLIIDSLKGWVIEDDNKKYVQRIELNCHNENYILVVIERMK